MKSKFQQLEKLLNANPQALKLIDQKKLLQKFSLQELAQLPPGTFGQIYGHRMISQNLNSDFFPYPKELNRQRYVMLLIRQTHDMWHVATGFDTSPLGEIGLQSFMLAQLIATPPLISGRCLEAKV